MKPPPHSVEAEQAFLGALLICDAEVWPAAELRGLAPIHFYKEAHRHLWAAAQAVRASGSSVDVVTLVDRLRDEKRLDAVGGLSYIASLSNAVSTVANCDHYLQRVLDTYARRHALEQLTTLAERLYDPDGLEALGEVGRVAASAQQVANAERTSYTIAEAIDAHVAASNAVEEGHTPLGWLTGLDALDVLLGARRVTYPDDSTGLEGGSLEPGRTVLLAGVNKHGKSSLARQIILGLLIQQARVLYVSTEMGADEVTPLLVSQLAGVALDVVQGHASRALTPIQAQKEARRVLDARAWLRRLGDQLQIDEHAGPTRSQILARAELAYQRAGLDVLVVDHLHHTQPEPWEGRLSQGEVYTNTLKALVEWGRRRRVLVLVVAQASPSSAKDHKRGPTRDEIVWCKTASSVVHTVLGIYRPYEAVADGAAEGIDPAEAWVNVAAVRGGLSGTKALLRFDGPSRAFSDPGDWRPVQPSKAEIIPIDGGRGRGRRSTKASNWQ